MLLSLSSNPTTATEEFIAGAKIQSKEKGLCLQQCSQKIECSVQELLGLLRENALLSSPLPSDTHEITQAKRGKCTVYVCMYTCMCTCTCMYIDVHLHIHCTCLKLHVHFHLHVHVHVCTFCLT